MISFFYDITRKNRKKNWDVKLVFENKSLWVWMLVFNKDKDIYMFKPLDNILYIPKD
jgi:hypothetical protein